MKRLIIIFLLVYLLAQVTLTKPAMAASASSASSIAIQPFLQTITIKQGDAQEQFELSINNGSSFTQHFHLAAINFGSLNETGGLVFEGANANNLINKYGLANWLNLSTNDFELAAKQQTTVIATISNRSDLSPGAHYAAIVTTVSKPIAAVGQLTITPKVSSLVFATKLGGEFYNMHLVSLSQNGNRWNFPTSVSLRFKSTGNTFIIPRGIVWLKQGGKVIAKGIINQQSSIVLPETIRDFSVPLVQVNKPTKGLVTASYQLRADYRYDGINQFATQGYTYRIFNILTIIGIGFLVIVGLVARKYRREFKRFRRFRR